MSMMRSFFTAAGHAAASLAYYLFRRGRERPGTSLRCLCVAAFDFAARAEGRPLDREKRKALGCLLDLGAMINDHFDQGHFRKNAYRELRRRLADNAGSRIVFREYFRRVRQAERNRPKLRIAYGENLFEDVVRYREQVVRLSLSALTAIAFGRPEVAGGDWGRHFPDADECLVNLFAFVMLIQICDDLLDWREDLEAGLPTFVTAAVLLDANQAEENGRENWRASERLEIAAAKYRNARSKQQGFDPLDLCRHAAFLFVKVLCQVVLRTDSQSPEPNNCLASQKPMLHHAISLED
jgi:hypothetical protein